MNRSEYLNYVSQFLYQGEVAAEATLNLYVANEPDPMRRYKWATLLQLETETKARLRPFLTRLGLSIVQDDFREQAAKVAQSYGAKSWTRHMEETAKLTDFYLAKFREVDEAAPAGDREVTHSMVLHEAAINRFAKLELEGDSANSLNDVIAQLKYPLAKPATA